MLYDKGLATPEYKENQKRFLAERASGQWSGCIGELICEKCDHIIADSICLCVGIFTCPNCGHRNGAAIEAMIRSAGPVKEYPVTSMGTGVMFDFKSGSIISMITSFTRKL